MPVNKNNGMAQSPSLRRRVCILHHGLPVVGPPGTGLKLMFYRLVSMEGMGACRYLTGIAVLHKSSL